MVLFPLPHSSSHSLLPESMRTLTQFAGPVINLCLLLPNAVAPDGKIDPAPRNWSWVHVLVLPVDKLATLSFILKPYKWIRFVAGAILAAHGHLSGSPDSPDPPVDYDAPLPTKSQTVYYHCDEEERVLIFPADPHMVQDDPDWYTSDPQFRFAVGERDGEKCVVTGDPPIVCRAAYIVPYYRGNAYIERLTSRRAEEGYDVVDEINDERNGVYINVDMEFGFGDFLGLMKTPNFALTTRDVDPNAHDPDEERVSIHLLRASLVPSIYPMPNGSRVRVPTGEDAEWWPPECLLEASYGSAVLKTFGVEDAKEHISRVWAVEFYPVGPLRARMDEDGYRHRRSPSPADVDVESNEDLDLGSHLIFPAE